MELKEIRQIVELMNKHDLSLFHLEKEGFKIRLRKGIDWNELGPLLQRQAPIMMAQPIGGDGSQAAASAKTANVISDVSDESEITSPMVGTFYRAGGPDAPPFVTVGTQVEPDTVVCIIEAMKVMNEIKAECSGTISKILADDAHPVQYGQPLFLVNPA